MSKVWNVIIAIRHTFVVRLLLVPLYYPAFYVKQCALLLLYRFSGDSQFVKSLRDKHEGERCFIIGNGPSLTAADLDCLKGEVAFASNKIYKMYDATEWRPTYYLCTDPNVGAEIKTEIRELKDSIKFLANSKGKKDDHSHRIYRLVVAPWHPGIRPEKFVQKKFTTHIDRYISKTQTVTCTAIEMAVYMGFKEIYLLGIDHTFAVEKLKNGTMIYHTGVKNHFEGGECDFKAVELLAAPIEASTQCYQVCQDYAIAHGIKIYNCTRGGRLEVFERKNLEEVIGKEKGKNYETYH